MSSARQFRSDAEPVLGFRWLDAAGAPRNLSNYVGSVELVDRSGAVVLSKSSGVTTGDGADGAANVAVSFDVGELAVVPPASYRLHLRITASDRDEFFAPGNEPVISVTAPPI